LGGEPLFECCYLLTMPMTTLVKIPWSWRATDVLAE
jgi:hypothetical protein